MRISHYTLNALIPSLLFFSFLQLNLNAQLIGNPDFEDYSDCPTGLDQVSYAVGWDMAVESADYYNCDFITSFIFPSDSGASSGSGCMGMASYGQVNGAAEAIGTELLEPFEQGEEYLFLIDVKMTNGGFYNEICSGISFYGFEDVPELPLVGEHISSLPGAVLLDSTNMVVSEEWVTDSIQFVAQGTYSYLVITNGISYSCPQYVFVDNIREGEIVHVEELTSDLQLLNNMLHAGDQLRFSENFQSTPQLMWYDLSGKLIAAQSSLNVPATLAKGFYVVQVVSADMNGLEPNYKVYVQ